MELGGAGSVDYAVRHQNRNDKCYVDNTASWITIQETICPGIIHPSREMSDSIVQETGSSLVNMSCVWLKKVTLQKREPSWLVLCLHNVPLPQGTLLSWGFEIHRVTLNGEYNTTVSAEPWSSSKAFRERKMKTYTIWFKSWMPQQDYTWNLRGERVGDFHSTNLSVPLHCSVFPQLVTINISSSVSTSYFLKNPYFTRLMPTGILFFPQVSICSTCLHKWSCIPCLFCFYHSSLKLLDLEAFYLLGYFLPDDFFSHTWPSFHSSSFHRICAFPS